MYGIAGERWLPELELPWLPGYENSTPVRIGNGAVAQRQLDVYGELMDVLHAAREAELARARRRVARAEDAAAASRDACGSEPDHGIWETRGPARAFTHSRVMSWVAFDRAREELRALRARGPVERWRELRDRDPRRHLRERLRRASATRSCSTTAAKRSTRRCC